MVRNLSREFATMTEEERRRFALEQGKPVNELDLDDPRNPAHMGRHYPGGEPKPADAEAQGGGGAPPDGGAPADGGGSADDKERARPADEEQQGQQGG